MYPFSHPLNSKQDHNFFKFIYSHLKKNLLNTGKSFLSRHIRLLLSKISMPLIFHDVYIMPNKSVLGAENKRYMTWIEPEMLTYVLSHEKMTLFNFYKYSQCTKNMCGKSDKKFLIEIFYVLSQLFLVTICEELMYDDVVLGKSVFVSFSGFMSLWCVAL